MQRNIPQDIIIRLHLSVEWLRSFSSYSRVLDGEKRLAWQRRDPWHFEY